MLSCQIYQSVSLDGFCHHYLCLSTFSRRYVILILIIKIVSILMLDKTLSESHWFPDAGNKSRRARFGRRHTHNEELCIGSCEVILGRTTFYVSEALNGVWVNAGFHLKIQTLIVLYLLDILDVTLSYQGISSHYSLAWQWLQNSCHAEQWWWGAVRDIYNISYFLIFLS